MKLMFAYRHAHAESLNCFSCRLKPHNFIPNMVNTICSVAAQLAIKLGVEPDHTFVIENGQVVILLK